MSKKNSQILTLGLIGLGVYLLTRRPQPNYNAYPNYPQIPPAPPQGTQAWQQWVQAIVQTFGAVASLWQPGGPFYNQPVDPAQAIEIGTGQQYGSWV